MTKEHLRKCEWKPIVTTFTERPSKKWIIDIEEDIQIIGIKGWRMHCKERGEWKRITVKATHRRMQRQCKKELNCFL